MTTSSRYPASHWASIRAQWITARLGYTPGDFGGYCKGRKGTAKSVALYTLRNWPLKAGDLLGLCEVAGAFGVPTHGTVIDCCRRVQRSTMLVRKAERLVSEGRIAMEAEYRGAILRLAACGRT